MLKQKEIRAQCEKWSKEMEYYINDEQIGQSVTASYVSLKVYLADFLCFLKQRYVANLRTSV